MNSKKNYSKQYYKRKKEKWVVYRQNRYQKRKKEGFLISLEERELKTKRCSVCKQEKLLSEFRQDLFGKEESSGRCEQCCRKVFKANYERQKQNKKFVQDVYVRNRKNDLKRKYGITPEDYNALYEKQNGCCAICGRHQSKFKYSLNVDHNSETGHIRGLLCSGCNPGLGHFEKDPELLIKAYHYLRTDGHIMIRAACVGTEATAALKG